MTDKPLPMRAYYYEFTPTGVLSIDRILSAVAGAGNAFHHTDGWNEPWERSQLPGSSPVDCIQQAANAAAMSAANIQAELEAEKATHEAVRIVFDRVAISHADAIRALDDARSRLRTVFDEIKADESQRDRAGRLWEVIGIMNVMLATPEAQAVLAQEPTP